MGRLASVLFLVSGVVALQVLAQAVLLASIRAISRRMQDAPELRRTWKLARAMQHQRGLLIRFLDRDEAHAGRCTAS